MNGGTLTSVALLLSGSVIAWVIGLLVLRATLGRGSLTSLAFDLQPVRLSPPGGHNRVMTIRKG